jgi:hypothetical protein
VERRLQVGGFLLTETIFCGEGLALHSFFRFSLSNVIASTSVAATKISFLRLLSTLLAVCTAISTQGATTQDVTMKTAISIRSVTTTHRQMEGAGFMVRRAIGTQSLCRVPACSI